MQRENVLIAGLLAAIILCVGVAHSQDFVPQAGTFIIVAAVCIRGDDFFNLTGIDAGSYELYFKQQHRKLRDQCHKQPHAGASYLRDPGDAGRSPV